MKRIDTKRVLLASASALALTVMAANMAHAATDVVGAGGVNITANSATAYDWQSAANNTLNISNSATLSGVVGATAAQSNGSGIIAFGGNGTVSGAVGNGSADPFGVTVVTGATGAFTGTVNLTGNVTLSGTGNLSFSNTTGIGGVVSVANGTATFTGAVTSTAGSVVASTSGNGTLVIGAGAATNFTTASIGNGTNSIGTVTLNTTGTATVNGTGATMLNATTTNFAADGTLLFNGAAPTIVTNITASAGSANGTVALNNSGATTFTGSIGNSTSAIKTLVIGTGTGTRTISGAVYTNNISFAAAGVLNTTGNLTASGGIAFAGNNGTINLNGTNTIGNISSTSNSTGNVVSNNNATSTFSSLGNSTSSLATVTLNGTATINSGSSIFATTTTIGSSGNVTLGGNVTARGDGAGASSVTFAGGTMNVAGNVLNVSSAAAGGATSLTASANSVLKLTIGSAGHGYITGNGTMNVNTATANISILPTISGRTVNNGNTFIVAQTTGTMTKLDGFKLSSLANTSMVTWAVGNTTAAADSDGVASAGADKGVMLTATVKSASSVMTGASSGAQATVDALNTYSGTNTGLISLQNAVQSLSSASEVTKAGEQLKPSGNTNASTFTAANQATTGTLTTIAARTDSMRLAANGGSGVNSGDALRGIGVWGEGFGSMAEQNTRDSITGYDARTAGLAVGVDTKVAEGTRLGVAFSYARTGVDGKGSNAQDATTINSYIGTLYGSYTGKPWYVNGALSAGVHDYKTSRVVNFTGFNDTALGNHIGMQYTAKVDGGYPIPVGPAVLTPVIGMTYTYLDQEGYTETSTNGAALKVNSTDTWSLRSQLGAKLDTTYKLSGGHKLTPQVRAAWLHEFNSNAMNTTAAFAAGGASFTSNGLKPTQEAAQLGLGLTIANTNNLKVEVGYDAEVRTDYLSHTGRLQIRSDF